MSTSCSGLLSKYAECLRSTECVKSGKHELRECMAQKAPECESFRYALFHCKRGQMDARTRIQGNKGY
ncbi:cytochrome c oxidase assembly protein [Haematococcus lacustris]